MEFSDRIEHQWTIIHHITTHIQAADSKASAGLAVLGIIFGFLLKNDFFSIKNLITAEKYTVIIILTILVFCLWVVLVVSAMYYALLCLVNRTGSGKLSGIFDPPIQRSVSTTIYFGQICKLKSTEYESRVLFQNENDVLSDLIFQSHTLSKIAAQKYSWLSNCYMFTAGVLIIALFMMGLSIFV